MKRIFNAIVMSASFFVNVANAEVFSNLVEGTVYYAKYMTLFEDDEGILWAEDSFTEKKALGHYCTDHTVAVKKLAGELYIVDVPRSVKIQRGVFDKSALESYGPGTEKFLKTKIRFANSLPDENREYTAGTLPEGKSGWLLSWELLKMGEGNFKVRRDATLEVTHYYANRGLFVKKINGRLFVDKTTFDKEKKEYSLDSVKQDRVFVGAVSTDSSSASYILAMAQAHNIEVGKSCNVFLDAEIIDGLLD